MRRYNRTIAINFGTRFGTSYIVPLIRENIKNGNIRYKEYILQEGERLDTIAGQFYMDATLWWIIASASEIGFALQTPPGTQLKIPLLEDVAKYAG
jgi:hypothetical protein